MPGNESPNKLIDPDRLVFLAILLIPINMTISGLILITLLFKTIKLKTNQLVPEKIKNLFYLFLIYSLIQGLFTYNPVYHYAGLIGHYIIYLLFFNILSKIIDNKEKLNQLINSVISSGSILAISGIIIFLLSDIDLKFIPYNLFEAKGYLIDLDTKLYAGRASGISMNPNILAIYLVISLIFTLNKLNISKQWLSSFIIFFLQILCLFFSYSRGAVLAFFVTLPFLLKNISRKFSYITVSIPLIIILINPYFIDRLIKTLDFNHNLDNSRIFVWQKTLEIISDNWQGIGILSFENLYRIYNYENYKHIPHAHNWFLQTTAESGIIGAIIFFTFFSFIIYYFAKNLKKEDKYITLSLLAFIIFNLADYVLTDTRITLIMTAVIFIGFFKINKSKMD